MPVPRRPQMSLFMCRGADGKELQFRDDLIGGARTNNQAPPLALAPWGVGRRIPLSPMAKVSALESNGIGCLRPTKFGPSSGLCGEHSDMRLMQLLEKQRAKRDVPIQWNRSRPLGQAGRATRPQAPPGEDTVAWVDTARMILDRPAVASLLQKLHSKLEREEMMSRSVEERARLLKGSASLPSLPTV